jgi:hypothetical protein
MGFNFGKAIVSQVKDRVYKKVVGGVGDIVRGIPGLGNSSILGQLIRNNLNPEHRSFPLDVEQQPGLGNQGHYILFYINEQENAKLSFGTRQPEAAGFKSVLEEQGKRGIPNYIREIIGQRGVDKYESKKYDGAKNDLLDAYGAFSDIGGNRNKEGGSKISQEAYENLIQTAGTAATGGYGRTQGNYASKQSYKGMNVKRKATRRLKTSISMYMPNDIEVTYGAGYKDQPIGTLSENVLQAYSQFSKKQYGAAGQSIVNMDEGLKQMLAGMLTATLGVLPGMGGIKELYAMREGKVYSNRIEVAFTGLEKRKFNYTFKMTPRSEEEAEEIRAIIFAFKANMLPELDGDYEKGRRMVIPNTFDIKYMYQGDENQYLNKISTCVLENLNVKYGSGQFQAFKGNNEGAPMVETSISLQFKEMETITRERIFEGF